MEKKHATLLIQCSDAQGLIARLTNFISDTQGNIISLHEFVDSISKRFFCRIQWEINTSTLSEAEIKAALKKLIDALEKPEWSIFFSSKKPKMALFVSKFSHCLHDLLYRYKIGELDVEIPIVISNHENLRQEVEQLGIRYECVPINKQNKIEQEAKEIALMKSLDIDLIVLARYMQILSPSFVDEYPNQIINIHHSFLPAFPGAKPYHRAHQKGVKIVGATSHYVTSDLDQGPILFQDVINVTHRDTIPDLIRKGRDVEKGVLAKAVRVHLEHRILIHQNKSVIFQ